MAGKLVGIFEDMEREKYLLDRLSKRVALVFLLLDRGQLITSVCPAATPLGDRIAIDTQLTGDLEIRLVGGGLQYNACPQRLLLS